MRVLHIGKYFPPHTGGMETFLRDLMQEQQAQGFEVAALVHASRRTFRTYRELYVKGQSKLDITRVACWFTLSFVPFSPSFFWALKKSIRRFSPDVIHLHMPNASAFWTLATSDARKIPWIIHWQSDVVTSRHKRSLRLFYPFYRLPEQSLLKKAAHVIATSPPYLATSEPLAQHAHKCTVVPLARRECESIDSKSDKGADDEINPLPPLKVLTVCRLTYYKGLNYLLEAIANTPETTLTLIGDGEELKSIRNLAQRLQLGDRFIHIPHCSDQELRKHYQSHDVFCLPSIERTEAFGVVLLEAMFMGLACLVTDVPGSGMSWVVDAPDAGYVTPHADAKALSYTLEGIYRDRDKLRTVAAQAKARYEEHLSMKRCHESIKAIYEQAVGRNASPIR